MMKKIHPDHDIFVFSLGDNHQNRITFVTSEPDLENQIKIISPGRIVLVGDIEKELRDIITRHGRPYLNGVTATNNRPAGAFPSNAFFALREHLKL